MHNSGLPDRYRSDRDEFFKLEEHIKAIVDTGLVPASHSANDALAECYEIFATALQVRHPRILYYLPHPFPNTNFNMVCLRSKSCPFRRFPLLENSEIFL
jgi:hypothetical protein